MAGQTVYFSYHSLNRLAAASGDGVGVPTGGDGSESYSYDGVGNLLAKTFTGGGSGCEIAKRRNAQKKSHGSGCPCFILFYLLFYLCFIYLLFYPVLSQRN